MTRRSNHPQGDVVLAGLLVVATIGGCAAMPDFPVPESIPAYDAPADGRRFEIAGGRTTPNGLHLHAIIRVPPEQRSRWQHATALLAYAMTYEDPVWIALRTIDGEPIPLHGYEFRNWLGFPFRMVSPAAPCAVRLDDAYIVQTVVVRTRGTIGPGTYEVRYDGPALRESEDDPPPRAETTSSDWTAIEILPRFDPDPDDVGRR